MATLAQFLRTGSLGPVVLGMDPFEVVDKIGDPEQESRKKNPLTMKYGSLQLVFWKHGPKSQLRDIVLNFLPEFEPLPRSVAMEDFHPNGQATEKYFRNFMHEIRYLPAHLTEVEGGRQLAFLSGVVVDFADGLLNSIRITQKEKKEVGRGPLSDIREPSRGQILEMIAESERALSAGALRSSLMIAWAGMEATLRRAALQRGRHGQVGVQPSVLIRELLSSGVLSPNESRTLEELRQLRTSSAHGLAPVDFSPAIISEINDITRRMLADTGSWRRQKEIADIFPIEANEAYSVIVRDRFCDEMFNFLQSKGLRGRIERNVIGGEDVQHDIQIEKSIPFHEFNRVLNEWKESYINS